MATFGILNSKITSVLSWKIIFRCYHSFLRVVVGYDDLVYTTSTGNNVILQHGQSWTFECQYKINSEGIINSTTLGKPGNNTSDPVITELPFEFNIYSDENYNQVICSKFSFSELIFCNWEKYLFFKTIEKPFIDISPSAPLPEPLYIGIKMDPYGDHWLHLQQCELIGEDGGFQEIIVKDGCSTDEVLYRLQSSKLVFQMKRSKIQNYRPLWSSYGTFGNNTIQTTCSNKI